MSKRLPADELDPCKTRLLDLIADPNVQFLVGVTQETSPLFHISWFFLTFCQKLLAWGRNHGFLCIVFGAKIEYSECGLIGNVRIIVFPLRIA